MNEPSSRPRCPYCRFLADLKQTDWGPTWRCDLCDARVGCHPGTIKPLGTLANAELRRKRMATHARFDPLWKSGRVCRKEAYIVMQLLMGMSEPQAHIAQFGLEECDRLLDALDNQEALSRAIRQARRIWSGGRKSKRGRR